MFIKGFEINYNKEGSLKDSIKIYHNKTSANDVEYLLESEKTGNELCVTKIYWK